MTTNVRPAVTTAIAATLGGAVFGGVVFTATGRNLHLYLRFVGLFALFALIVVGVWAYRTYVTPKGAHVEETDTEVPA